METTSIIVLAFSLLLLLLVIVMVVKFFQIASDVKIIAGNHFNTEEYSYSTLLFLDFEGSRGGWSNKTSIEKFSEAIKNDSYYVKSMRLAGIDIDFVVSQMLSDSNF